VEGVPPSEEGETFLSESLLASSPQIDLMGNKNILVWNVQGLNARSHRAAVQELVEAEKSSLVCL
jgi:hypothetical protein